MSWQSGLHRRGHSFVMYGSDDQPADRIQLVPNNLRPTFRSLSGGGGSRSCSQFTQWTSSHRKVVLSVAGVAALLAAAVLAGVYLGGGGGASSSREPPDPETPLPPSPSKLHTFQRGAVCTDSEACSKIGRDVLRRNGSAVDAAVAAAFCNGLTNMASMGIGGGFFMTVYIKSEERAYSVVAREKAPAAASQNMFKDKAQASKGGSAVGVPGEVRGLWVAHRRWGALPWAELVAPSVQLCREGFQLSKVLYDTVQFLSKTITEDPQLRKMYYSEKAYAVHGAGAAVKPHDALCRTLQRVAAGGADDMYSGQLARDAVADVRDRGGIVTEDDFTNYTAKITDPIEVQLQNGDTLYTPPPPSSGLLLGNILNILSGYNLTGASVADVNSTVRTYHRIVEAFKFAYATRSLLGDIDYLPDLPSLIARVTQPAYAAEVRANISEARTYGDARHYGAQFASTDDAGTAHFSVVAPNGDAVSLTSSINYYFGAGFAGSRTGIIFNNVMDDFSSPNFKNYFGFAPSPANYIRPNKRPLSSMSPSIIVDRNKNAKMVIGASGGSKITTAIALVIMNKIWFDRSLKQAVDAPRIHHQLIPPAIDYEYGNLKGVIEGLKAIGHNATRYRDRGSIVCAVFRNKTAIYANADFRKGGEVYGID